MKKNIQIILMLLLAVNFILSGCSKNTQTTSSAVPTNKPNATSSAIPTGTTDTTAPISPATSNNTEVPVATEKNPPGDIPDTQVFVTYTSTAGGYQLQVPEGWARTENASDVTFVNNYDGVKVEVANVSYSLSTDNISNNYVTALKNNGRAITVNSIDEVTLKNLTAVKLSFSSNSEPDPVTDKQIRLENESFFFIKDGKMAVLSLWAPSGADNVDQWKLMSDSFNWS